MPEITIKHKFNVGDIVCPKHKDGHKNPWKVAMVYVSYVSTTHSKKQTSTWYQVENEKEQMMIDHEDSLRLLKGGE